MNKIPNLIDWAGRTFRVDKVLKDSLSDSSGKYSEKKLTKFYIIMCMMVLTFLDFFVNSKDGLRWDILGLWLGYAFGNVWALSQDKKIETKTSAASQKSGPSEEKSDLTYPQP